MYFRRVISIALACLFITSCVIFDENDVSSKGLTIAFMPDVHFHDVYGNFKDGQFVGLKNSKSDRYATIRSMRDQLTSTRLFNENYFAFIAALDDAIAKNIKLIVLPGDFSDDGQPVHLRGLKKILVDYQQRYGVEFLMSPGNHDPTRPFARIASAKRFLMSNGDTAKIYSDSVKKCSNENVVHNEYCTVDMHQLGYDGINELFGAQGFQPKSSYRYWATPFSDFNYQHYTFDKAIPFGKIESRQFEICDNGSGGIYRHKEAKHCRVIPDLSYVVETSNNLWLLAIDANIFVPTQVGFQSPSNAGYNKVFKYKRHLIDWIKRLVKDAKRQNKTLIAFSHFPMADFYDNADEDIVQLFGKGKLQLKRLPTTSITKELASIGLKFHVGGHMHFNDTSFYNDEEGNVLLNVQAPSLAAYIPAYKTITLQSAGKIEVNTVVLNNVPRFNELFEHYQAEHAFMLARDGRPPWDISILETTTYREFTNAHIEALTKSRFVPAEWPASLQSSFLRMTGEDMLVLANLVPDKALTNVSLAALKNSSHWQSAMQRSKAYAMTNQLNWSSLSTWTGIDLATDFYRLRNAGLLAIDDIGREQVDSYLKLSNAFEQTDELNNNALSALQRHIKQLLTITKKFSHEEESRHFIFDMNKGDLTSLYKNDAKNKKSSKEKQ